MLRLPPRPHPSSSSAAADVYKRPTAITAPRGKPTTTANNAALKLNSRDRPINSTKSASALKINENARLKAVEKSCIDIKLSAFFTNSIENQ